MSYQPKGLRFFDLASGLEMLLVADGEPFSGWICYRHPDGQWVTHRRATEDDRKRLNAEIWAAWFRDDLVDLLHLRGLLP